jgi:hypothetical protein
VGEAYSLLIADSHGINFLVRDMFRIDKGSRKILDRFCNSSFLRKVGTGCPPYSRPLEPVGERQLFQKAPVVRHDDERPRPRRQHRFQRLHAREVEVVRRLVQHQQLRRRLAQHGQQQCAAHAFAAAQLFAGTQDA